MIRLAVGLGNPGPKYAETRHNLGQQVVMQLAGQSGEKFKKETDGAMACSIRSFFPDGSALRLATLTSYMNESGIALSSALKYHKLSPADLLVVFDDFSLPFGTIRLRPSGSAGGHNGMKSIIETLGTQDFTRLRLGIGPIPEGRDPADFVLQKFTKVERGSLGDFTERSVRALDAAARDLAAAMNAYNRTPESTK